MKRAFSWEPGLLAEGKTWLGFGALCIGMFMAILDIQVVVTSLPVIEEALGIGADRMSWVQTTYLIAEVISIPLTGVLIRVFTVRWLFVAAIAAFTAASIGCALSFDFYSLIVFRVLQGFSGGVLIPLVFSAIFLMFEPGLRQTIATTMGGLLAVLAPTLGPLTGGWITEHYTWHWLFLINVFPGVVTLLIAWACLARDAPLLSALRRLDWVSVGLVAVSLACLLIGLKQAPEQGWLQVPVLTLFLTALITMTLAVRRPTSAISFSLLGNRNLSFGCALSFLLGACLYGAVYLIPVFLAFVRGMGPLEIGMVTLVTGISQLIAAPIAVQLDRRLDARLLSAFGFGLFALGLAMDGNLTLSSGYDAMFWPQVVRGVSVAFCILPPVRFALGFIARADIADASGLFNLSRNLGGAIGIAVIDTIIFTRSASFAEQITEMLKTAPDQAARLLEMPVSDLPDPGDPSGLMGIMDVIQQAGLTQAINESWWMLAATCAAGLVVLLVMGPIRPPAEPK